MGTARVFWGVALLAASAVAQTTASPAQVDRIHQKVGSLGVAREVTVNLFDGTQYCGTIAAVRSDRFEVNEVDLGRMISVPYSEVKKVREGYGRKGFRGRRVYPRTNRIVGLAVIGGLIGLAFWGATQTR